MSKVNRTAEDFRASARSLTYSAAADQDSTRSAGYANAAGRCNRVANLMDRGLTLDEATSRVIHHQEATR